MPAGRHVPRREGDSGREPESRVDREITQPAAVVRLMVRRALSPESPKAEGRTRPKADVRLRIGEPAAAEDQDRPETELPEGETSRRLKGGARPVVQT